MNFRGESEPAGFIVPDLGVERELALMEEMAMELEDACDVEIRSESNSQDRDPDLIKAVFQTSAFQNGNTDWAFDIASKAFLERHKGTPEATRLKDVIERARVLIKGPQ
jgi:hypothetical protein